MSSERPLEKYDHFSLPTVVDLHAELTDTLGYSRAETLWNLIKKECSISSENFLKMEELRRISEVVHRLIRSPQVFWLFAQTQTRHL